MLPLRWGGDLREDLFFFFLLVGSTTQKPSLLFVSCKDAWRLAVAVEWAEAVEWLSASEILLDGGEFKIQEVEGRDSCGKGRRLVTAGADCCWGLREQR